MDEAQPWAEKRLKRWTLSSGRLFSVRKGRTRTFKMELADPARNASTARRVKFWEKQIPRKAKLMTNAEPIKGSFRGTFSRIKARGIAINPDPKKLIELKRAIFSLENPTSRR
jgi:hypothetical protein